MTMQDEVEGRFLFDFRDHHNFVPPPHVFTAVVHNVVPNTVSAPEIDPSSAVAGITLLVGCLAVMMGKKTHRGALSAT